MRHVDAIRRWHDGTASTSARARAEDARRRAAVAEARADDACRRAAAARDAAARDAADRATAEYARSSHLRVANFHAELAVLRAQDALALGAAWDDHKPD
jgi:hypothetical protein